MKDISDCTIEYLFGKELPREQNFLFIEDINAKGHLFLLNLTKDFIKRGLNVVLVLLDSVPSNVLEELVVKESENFSVVNTYSNLYSKYYTSIQLHELNLTLKALRRQLKSEKGLIMLFWSLNPLFIHFSSNDVIHFYSENVKHAIENNTIEFYLIGKGIIEDMVIRRLIAISHCVLELEKDSSHENKCDLVYLKTMGMNIHQNILHYEYKEENSIWDSKIFIIDHL